MEWMLSHPEGGRAKRGRSRSVSATESETTAGGDEEKQQKARNCGRSITFLDSPQKLWRPIFQAIRPGRRNRMRINEAHLLV